MKTVKQSLEHIELVSSGDTALFEVRLVVAMHDWQGDEADEGFDEVGALGWLMNLLMLAADGKDVREGAQEFLKAMMTLSESRVHLCKVEKVEYNERGTK